MTSSDTVNSFVRASARPRAHRRRFQNTFISTRLRGTHSSTPHLNEKTHVYMVLCLQHRTLYTHVHTRAPAAIPVRCAPAHKAGSTVRAARRTCRIRPGWSRRPEESAHRPLWSVERCVSAGYALRRGPTSGETRGEGAEPARGRCGGKRAPLGELVVDEQRAGMSSVTRPACREGTNGARQQWKRLRGRNTRAMRATTRAARCGIARPKRGLRACATYPRVGGAGSAWGSSGWDEARDAHLPAQR